MLEIGLLCKFWVGSLVQSLPFNGVQKLVVCGVMIDELRLDGEKKVSEN